jgi:hypothetical protein
MATKTRNELDAADRDALPESRFAFPRVRKEPLTDARHVRNAIARFDQVQDVSDQERDEAFGRIQRAAKKFGVEMTESHWQELGRPGRSKRAKTPSGDSKAELYARAKSKGIAGRSTMTKAELQRALRAGRHLADNA